MLLNKKKPHLFFQVPKLCKFIRKDRKNLMFVTAVVMLYTERKRSGACEAACLVYPYIYRAAAMTIPAKPMRPMPAPMCAAPAVTIDEGAEAGAEVG